MRREMLRDITRSEFEDEQTRVNGILVEIKTKKLARRGRLIRTQDIQFSARVTDRITRKGKRSMGGGG